MNEENKKQKNRLERMFLFYLKKIKNCLQVVDPETKYYSVGIFDTLTHQ